jgi:hydroxymethylglutaryl-CoA synthase
MAHKAHRTRCAIDGLDEAAADRDFETTVAPSLRFSAQVGNIYAGSLYLALASLLHAEAAALEGQRIGLFSYGSGCAAEFFAGRVAPGAAAVVASLDLGAPLAAGARERLTIPAYETLRHGDVAADRRASEEGSDRPFAFLGIDPSERRRYMRAG